MNIYFLYYDHSLIKIENKALLFTSRGYFDLLSRDMHAMCSLCDKGEHEWAHLRSQGMVRDVFFLRPNPKLNITALLNLIFLGLIPDVFYYFFNLKRNATWSLIIKCYKK